MSHGVCFRRETGRWMQDQWSWVFSNYGLVAPNIWECGKNDARGSDWDIYQETIAIDLASELPDQPLVVLAHPDSRYIRGTESLFDFVHPADAIYLFGASHLNLSYEEDLGTRVPNHLVYIPSTKHEMYGHNAAYITLYDRAKKANG